MRQRWYDLLFAHWPVPAAVLQRYVPDSLKVQEYDGTSWLGVVPFRMEGIAPRGLPSLPWLSAFPELNVRIYVERDGKPGVWFLSLDATNPLAIWAAKRFFHLPYRRSAIDITKRDDGLHYRSTRGSEVFEANYRPVSEVFNATPGSLEAFLAERYCLYAQSKRGALYRGEVHHAPWPLQRAEGSVHATALLGGHGLTVEGKPLMHFSKGVDVVVWSLEKLIC
ncbi:DUF2071 domain-containing protein [soil metagenome]